MEEYSVISEIKRSDFIIERWSNDFPNVSHLSWDEIAKLISRSTALQDWYFKQLQEMQILVDMPSWAREVMSFKEFDKVRNDLSGYNEALNDLSNKIALVARRRNDEVKQLRADFSAKWESTLSNAHIFIFTLRTDQLPIRILMEIENYSQKTEKDLTKSQFSRMKLDSFKRKLFDMNAQGHNVFDYVKDEALKF